MSVPFLDLKAQYARIQREVAKALQEVIDRTAFAGGPFVDGFEKEFAKFCQTQEAVAVNSGTTALWMALLGLGIGRNDEVITVPNTFIATAEAISMAGAKPVFVDVDERTLTMDPDCLEEVITPRTKAIIPVHLHGQMADMDPILEIARSWGLRVIEDAAQAHGAEYKGRRAGSVGDVGCFSFYPGKNLGAYGEAGAVVTNNSEVANRLRVFRDHGQDQKYHHSMIGWNCRMDGFQAAVLSVKMKYIEEWSEKRRANASLYNELLSGNDSITLPYEPDYSRHVYHIYAIRTHDRDGLLRLLQENEIGCGIHYPVPVHLQQAYSSLHLGRGTFPIAERCAEEMISLPMFPELGEDQIKQVVDAVHSYSRGFVVSGELIG